MLRLLVTPRWLAATLFVLIAFPVCIRLGIWQWDRAHQKPRVLTASEERPVPLGDLLDGRPASLAFPVGLLVRATGHYDSGGALVADAAGPAGTTPRWLVHPFAADGAAEPIAVVRGQAVPAPSPPVQGDVVITGRIEPPVAATAGATPEGPATDRATARLTADALRAQQLDPRGYLVVLAQQPPDAKPPVLVAGTPPPPQERGLRWQNSTYAAQWWIFGFFFLFAWFRFFRDDLRASRRAATPA